MKPADATVEVREYIVTAWPADLDQWEAHYWEISVHRTKVPGMWAVTARGDLPILTKKGNWSWTMPRSLRSSCYMPLDEAISRAKDAAVTMTIGGRTIEDAIAAMEES